MGAGTPSTQRRRRDDVPFFLLPRRPRRLTRHPPPPGDEDGVEARAEVVRDKGEHGVDVDADDGAGHTEGAGDARRPRGEEARERDGADGDAPPRDDGVAGPRLPQHVVDGRDDGDGGAGGGHGAVDAVERRVAARGGADAGPRARNLEPRPRGEKGAERGAPVAAGPERHDAVLDERWTGVGRVAEAAHARGWTATDGMAGAAAGDSGGALAGAL